MACCGGGEAGNPEDRKKNEEISKMMKEEKRRLENEVKLLLLGAGESGKSTISKQMKMIFLEGFSNQERLAYKSIIYNNCISAIRTLVRGTAELGIPLGDEVKALAAKACPAEEDEDDDEYFEGTITKEIAQDIKTLWADDGIQKAFARSSEFQLIDSAAYYFENIERIASDDYIPDDQDLLRSRAKTTGIIETEFKVEGTTFKMVDVGGQRSERKKWMHCFAEVTAVIFCVALSEYDLKLYEDDTTNRMHESLKLFKEICNTKWFLETAMILFLNKKDLFDAKIKLVPLTVAFPDYKGVNDFTSASGYIKEQFIAQNENPKKQIYPHLTCATDTDNIKFVFSAVKDIILRKGLDDAGLL